MKNKFKQLLAKGWGQKLIGEAQSRHYNRVFQKWGSKLGLTKPEVIDFLKWLKDQEDLGPIVAEGDLKMVITWAQMATPVHLGFLKALELYCKKNDAYLEVIIGQYNNPQNRHKHEELGNDYYAAELEDYACTDRIELNNNLLVCGDVEIIPTATRPLTGMESFAHHKSCIFGHPRIQFSTVATANREYPRIIATTGTCTLPNYTNSKAGKKAAENHTIGAAIIEIVGEHFHLRQLIAEEDGSFIDLGKRYTPTKVEKAARPLALVCGDIHVAQEDPEVLEATLIGRKSIAKTLKPEKVVYHDVLDFKARSHHTSKSLKHRVALLETNQEDVETEVCDAFWFIDNHTPAFATPVVVQSNHDEHFDRWLSEANPKTDPKNARFYHETWATVLRYVEDTFEVPQAFSLLYEKYGAGRACFIDRDTPFSVGGVYLNFHGDVGSGGARGSASGFAKLGVRTVVGHSHCPKILDGCYTVGVTGKLNMGYNKLPSAWLNTHCLIYANGKRTLITVIEGKWKA